MNQCGEDVRSEEFAHAQQLPILETTWAESLVQSVKAKFHHFLFKLFFAGND